MKNVDDLVSALPPVVGECSEEQLVAVMTVASSRALEAVSGTAPHGTTIHVGNGDDAACYAHDQLTVTSVDMAVEGEDFLRTWSTPHNVGCKVAIQNLADVYAMGATPTLFFVSLGLPRDLPTTWVAGFADGLCTTLAHHGARVIGGDLSGAPAIVASITAQGTTVRPITRAGAHVGDAVVVTGAPGRSAVGWQILREEKATPETPAWAEQIAAHVAPAPQLARSAPRLKESAHAMMDVSDGLTKDASRIAAASGVTINLDSRAITALARNLVSWSTPPGHTPWLTEEDATHHVMSGGEDHELLATLPLAAAQQLVDDGLAHVIGHVEPCADHPITLDHQPYHGRTGFDHFTTDT